MSGYVCQECEDKDYKDRCILHCGKNDWYTMQDDLRQWNDSSEQIRNFWQSIRDKINYDIKVLNRLSDEKIIVFENIIFPKMEDDYKLGSVQSRNSFFNKEKRVFEIKVEFKNCTFLDKLDISNIYFKKGLTFDNCIFENGLILKNMIFKKGSKVQIQNCLQITNANFANTTFGDLADFYNSTFMGNTSFVKTNFQDIVVFSEATFQEDIDFKYTTFNELAQFKNTKFCKILNLENTIIKEEVNFLGVTKDSSDTLIDVANRETARIIKHSFEKQDNIMEANKFYAIEMQEREKELSFFNKKNWIDWIIFKIHGNSSNHSQDPVLPLLWILNLACIYTMWISTFSHDNMLAVATIGLILASVFFVKKKIVNMWLLAVGLCFAFMSYITPESIANLINPFSKIDSQSSMTFGVLIFKILEAYLIYQFIVSVRQNTRRK